MRMMERAQRTLLVSLALSIFSFLPTAYAQCSNTASWSVGGPYILKDVGVVEAEGVNSQDEYTLSCGKLSFDVWVSFGKPDAAKEIDLSVFYDTDVGPFKTQFAAQYFALNLHGNSLAKAGDDIVELYADVSYPMQMGPFTVAPLIRFIEMIGVDELDSQTLIQPGVRLSVKPHPQLTLSADVRDSMNLTQGYATVRSAISGTWAVSDQWSLSLTYGDTDQTPHALYVGGAVHF